MTKFKGYVLQHGTSPVNGCPFVVIMTMDSGNTKTGNMCQVWILTENIHPVDAVNLGAMTPSVVIAHTVNSPTVHVLVM